MQMINKDLLFQPQSQNIAVRKFYRKLSGQVISLLRW